MRQRMSSVHNEKQSQMSPNGDVAVEVQSRQVRLFESPIKTRDHHEETR